MGIHYHNDLDENTKKRQAKELYSSLPYQILIPDYCNNENHEWKITVSDELRIGTDYFNLLTASKICTLVNKGGEDEGLWMSITSMEIQSHTIHLNSLVEEATRHYKEHKTAPTIVIGGLGMGMFLLNAIHVFRVLKIPSKIIVIEKSNNICELLQQSTIGYCNEILQLGLNKSRFNSVEVINDDIFNVEPIKDVQYMYVDIWQDIGNKNAAKESKLLVDKWNPNRYGYWTEELDVAKNGLEFVNELRLSTLYLKDEFYACCETLYEANYGFPATKQE